jgi:predicted nucleic acid-binding protein
MTVVSDASPLHYLVLIKAEHVLAQLFSEVFVPPAVLRELSHERAPERVRHGAAILRSGFA